MLTVKLLHKIKIDIWNFTQIRFLRENIDNHYEILKLKRSCTSKEIRRAFINLSKECHPDKQKNNDTHDKYVRILEAYKVLKNPESRAVYDISLRVINIPQYRSSRPSSHPYQTYYYDDPVKRAWSDPSFYANRHKEKYAPNHGLKKEMLITLFTVLGGVFVIYCFTIWKIFDNRRIIVDRETAKNFALLKEIRNRAENTETDEQIENLVAGLKRHE